MNKKDYNQLRIDVIKSERVELLKEVRESINEGNEKVIENANEIIATLDFDDKNIKKLQSLKEAQSLIENLTKEIVNATSKEEIDALRKKLNYYINKIKNEAKKRNIDYSKYYENVTNIRKDISKYIRFLKKNKQINEIEELNKKYDELDEETVKRLARQISNARNYNTRVMKEQNENSKVSEVKEEVSEKNHRIIMNLDTGEIHNKGMNDFNAENEQKKDKILEEVIVPEVKKPKRDDGRIIMDLDTGEIHNKGMNTEEESQELSVPNNKMWVRKRVEPSYESDKDFISSKVTEFGARYGIVDPLEYDSTLGTNIVSLIRNLSIYNSNRKKLKRINFDYSLYYHGDDLRFYMSYIKRDNSIAEGLKRLFHKSSLYTKENIYLSNHDRCVKWILNVVNNNNIDLKYNKLAK